MTNPTTGVTPTALAASHTLPELRSALVGLRNGVDYLKAQGIPAPHPTLVELDLFERALKIKEQQ
jgi:hypothetical protein